MKRIKGEVGVLDGRVRRAAYMKPRTKFIGGQPGNPIMANYLRKHGGFVHCRCSRCGRPLVTHGRPEDLDVDIFLCPVCWQKFNEASPIDPEIKSLNIDSGIPPRNSEIGTREPRLKKSKARRVT